MSLLGYRTIGPATTGTDRALPTLAHGAGTNDEMPTIG
jgi:hypothetical protein